MSFYRILSLDGGGLRGLIMAILLERLEQYHPGFLSQVDLFAGTSTGGLLALGLASGRTPTQARKLYEEKAAKVFTKSQIEDFLDLGSLVNAKYRLEPLKQALIDEFGYDVTLGELEKRVLISSFKLDNKPQNAAQFRCWKAKFFQNFPGPGSDADQKVVDVGLCTATAPTYFPTYHSYIDGGVVAGNPTVCALAQALDPSTGGQKLEDIVLLSLSTGQNPRYLDIDTEDWGLIQWGTNLLDILLDGDAGLADYQARQFLGARYLRLNPLLPEPISMDQVDKLSMLAQIASLYDISPALAWINLYFA